MKALNFTNMLIAVNDSLVINYDKTIPVLFSHTKYFIYQVEKAISEDASEFITMNASVDICPKTINLRSKGKWITAWIEIPGYDVGRIDISTVYLNGIVQAINDKHGFARHPEVKDRDGGGYPELIVKFDRKEVKKVLGEINSEYFFGVCSQRVILPILPEHLKHGYFVAFMELPEGKPNESSIKPDYAVSPVKVKVIEFEKQFKKLPKHKFKKHILMTMFKVRDAINVLSCEKNEVTVSGETNKNGKDTIRLICR